MRLHGRFFVVFILYALSGCTFDGQTSATLERSTQTEDGHFDLTLVAKEAGVAVGNNAYLLTVTPRNMLLANEMSVQVKPWMPDHGHGSDRPPRIQDNGGYEFALDNVVYTMPGFWELRMTISTEDITDAAVFELDIE